jgi:hypothetical protein
MPDSVSSADTSPSIRLRRSDERGHDNVGWTDH